MYNLVNSNYNRTYNPSGRQNALSNVKRLLNSRDTANQSKACGYLIAVVSRYNSNSEERGLIVEYLLDNDIPLFLCEATSNLDFTLFKSLTSCLRLLWRSHRFFIEEHAAHAMAAVLRALTYFAGSGPVAALDACMEFLHDLLHGISAHKSTPPLSQQSAYSAVQLLACLSSLAARIHTNQNSILSSALVLDALISYQPEGLSLRGGTASALVEVVKKWFDLLMGSLNHAMLVGDNGNSGMSYVVLCQLGISSLSLSNQLYHGKEQVDLVQAILSDAQEVTALKQCATDMATSIQRVISDLVEFTKEHQNQIGTEEYGMFLKLLLIFFHEKNTAEVLPEFCDMLFHRGYLIMLPQVQIKRNDTAIRKASTLVLGELLKVLADKYLNVLDTNVSQNTSANDIHMGLVELQYGIERPQTIGIQLQKEQSYSLLIYIYFYCQSSENPKETTGPLLPFLVKHILKLQNSFQPPSYIIKALWLVFAMATISSDALKSLDQRVYLEKATDRLVTMLQPEPSVYYTHNPAILLWAFTSQRIPIQVKTQVISQWLKFEDSLPSEFTTDSSVWEILLQILINSSDKTIVGNCLEALFMCLEDLDDELREEFSVFVWKMLPYVIAKALVGDQNTIGTNICYLLDVATALLPKTLDPDVSYKTAALTTVVFTKIEESGDNRHHLEHVCLKIALHLLGLAHSQNDNRVLHTYVNRESFLPCVLLAANSMDDRVACAALQLLTEVVRYFTKYKFQVKSVLQIQTNEIITSFRRDSHSERGTCLLQLVYMVLDNVNTPLGLTYELNEPPVVERQCNALRALMFRIQMMLCCRDPKNQSDGWNTLTTIIRHAVVTKNDTKLIATLTSQPWTHILVQFKLTQQTTLELLKFTHYWLTLLRITLRESQEGKKVNMCRHSFVVQSMVSIQRNLKVQGLEDELKEMAVIILGIVREILRESGVDGVLETLKK